jgi:hypothetical protein
MGALAPQVSSQFFGVADMAEEEMTEEVDPAAAAQVRKLHDVEDNHSFVVDPEPYH